MALTNPECFDFFTLGALHVIWEVLASEPAQLASARTLICQLPLWCWFQTGVITIVGFLGAFGPIIVQHEEVVTGAECRMRSIDYGPEVWPFFGASLHSLMRIVDRWRSAMERVWLHSKCIWAASWDMVGYGCHILLSLTSICTEKCFVDFQCWGLTR